MNLKTLACVLPMAIFTTGLITVTIAQPAFAQKKVLEEVIVTAQRREQSVQDVAMSITAFSSESLEARAIEGAEDIQFSLPNVVITNTQAVVRGVGNNAATTTAEAGLGYHVNGVYLKFPLTSVTEYFDTARIEVLRGPQGTLYGRNTSAGVINIITNRPGEEWEANLSATVGNYNTRKVSGALNIPVSDGIRQRFAALSIERDGYSYNEFTGNNVDGRDAYEVRSTTAFDLTEKLILDVYGSYLEEDSDRSTRTKGVCTKDAELGCSPVALGFETPDVTNSIYTTLNRVLQLYTGDDDYFINSTNPDDYRRLRMDQDPYSTSEQLQLAVEFNYAAEKFQLTSLSGYIHTAVDNFYDFDRFQTDRLLTQPLTYRANGKDFETTRAIKSGRVDILEAKQLTQEFRVASDFDGAVNFLLGLFYYRNEQVLNVRITHPLLAAGQDRLGLDEDFEFFHYLGDPSHTRSKAVFSELYYDYSANTRVTFGLRYTEDEKDTSGRLLFLNLIDPSPSTAQGSWSALTGKVTVEYSPSDDTLLFATLSRGYKAGGLNPGGAQSDNSDPQNLLSGNLQQTTDFIDGVTGSQGPVAERQFDPEFINAFEVGAKSTYLDGRFVANYGAFYYDYQGLQVGQIDEALTLTTNSDAEVYGAEAEFTFAVTDALILESSLAYLHTDIQNAQSHDVGDPNGEDPNSRQATDENGDGRTNEDGIIKDVSGNSLPSSPEYSVKLGAAYTFNIAGRFGLNARVDHFFQADYFANQFNKNTDTLDGWSQTDFQLVLFPNERNWKLRAFVKNIEDNDDVVALSQDSPLAGRFRSANVLEPQLYGLEFNYSY